MISGDGFTYVQHIWDLWRLTSMFEHQTYLRSTFYWNKNIKCEIGSYFELKFTTGITDIYIIWCTCMFTCYRVHCVQCVVYTHIQWVKFPNFVDFLLFRKVNLYSFSTFIAVAFQFIFYVKFTSKMVWLVVLLSVEARSSAFFHFHLLK